MMTLKQLKDHLNKIGPEYDDALVVQDAGDHSYCGVGFRFEDADQVDKFLYQGFDTEDGVPDLDPPAVRVKVLVAG